MKKKTLLIILVVAILGLVPLNDQLTFGYGESDGRSDGRASSPQISCNGAKPDKPILYEPGNPLLPKATGTGEVRLNWLRAQGASSYGVGVGLTPGNYIYGSPNVGDTTNFTVRFLNPGRTYYFAVRANRGCTPGDWSKEWAVRIGDISFTGSNEKSDFEYSTPFRSESSTLLTPTFAFSQSRETTNIEPTQVFVTQAPATNETFQSQPYQPQPESKLSLWQRILRLFGISK